MFVKNKYKFKWNSFFRCQYADEEIVELMKESGCEGVFIGIESGSQLMLENMNKSAKIDKYIMGLELLNKYDITSYASIIIGFPGETQDTVNETIKFIEDCKPTFYRAKLWHCDPCTPIWEEREKYNLKGLNFEWSHSTMNASEACKIIDNMFLSIKNSIWVPEYAFELYGVFNLLHRGMNLDEVKAFLKAFNLGIKEKIIAPNNQEISSEVSAKLYQACNPR
jgi:radical SAM superfamily enzyme YgiQ (UPF0313 family)